MPATSPQTLPHGRRGRLRLHAPAPEPATARWMIGSHSAILTVWSPVQWAELAVRPDDAQELAGGLVAQLRME